MSLKPLRVNYEFVERAAMANMAALLPLLEYVDVLGRTRVRGEDMEYAATDAINAALILAEELTKRTSEIDRV